MESIVDLKRKLNLKQIQINYLQEVTNAINNNVKANDLFTMYKNFLEEKLYIRKMALYFFSEKHWTCQTSIGLSEEEIEKQPNEELRKYIKISRIEDEGHSFLNRFDIIIPCFHKQTPISYALIGDIDNNEEYLSTIKFISTITNIISVAIENKRLFNNQIEQIAMEKEMGLARNMQQSLIPKDLPRSEHYEIATFYQPHLQVGGDYFDFVELGDDKLVICIGDIAGKGLAAGMLMANLQAYFHTLVKLMPDIVSFVKELNTSMLRSTKAQKFLTFFVCVFDVANQKLQYVNCGHNPPLFLQKGKIQKLDKGCTILGIFDNLPNIEVGELEVEGPATLLLYTDGLSDLKDEKGRFLPERYSERQLITHESLPAKLMIDKIMDQVNAFKGRAEFPDDLSLLCCKFNL